MKRSLLFFFGVLVVAMVSNAAMLALPQSEPIPLDQVGAVASQRVHDDSLSVTPNVAGARLRCAFQRLEGNATSEGLWLNSITDTVHADRFRLIAVAVGRQSGESQVLPGTGKVTVNHERVDFIRPGLTEEYSVSVDGVRQDFAVMVRPNGLGDLEVELALSGAQAKPANYGVTLRLEASGRELAYSKLRVTDALGRELEAHLDVPSADRLFVRVEDANAVYPVRIDPTFSDANWVSVGPAGMPGASSLVHDLVVDDSGNLYVGGDFTFIGTVAANHVARWDGHAWSALDSGIGGTVFALTMRGNNLYAGGTFTRAGGISVTNIAKWDGSAWSALGLGVGPARNNQVRALAVIGSDLYAGGVFSSAGETNVNALAKWDGSKWSPLGSGLSGGDFGPKVFVLEASNTDLYVGGNFTTAEGVPTRSIAKWDGSTWSGLGSGVSKSGGIEPSVYSLAVSGSDLYAGGIFNGASGVLVNNVAKWNGTTWSALGSGIDNFVLALAVSGSDLYAGGPFTMAGGISATNIAKWDGSTWSALSTTVNGSVGVLAVDGSDLLVAGSFTSAGGVPANYIAKWSGSTWSALGSGMNGMVRVLVVSGSDLYAGGEFTSAGGLQANYIAKWDGSVWSALGSGMSEGGPWGTSVESLALLGTNLYAGGRFTTAGGVSANHIARWDGSVWSALRSGVSGGLSFGPSVNALAVSGTNLYAGGNFSTAGAVSANFIAKWNGHAWSALGSGMNKTVLALAASGDNLYAGGEFTMADGATANYIAQWNGSEWSTLGPGMGYIVYALAASGANLYAGGWFTRVGSIPRTRHIAKWDGSAWTGLLGGDMDGTVRTLAVSGTNLYAAGFFAMAGTVPATRIAKWNGHAWSALGSGLDNVAFALAVDATEHLYVGGAFFQAGTNGLPYIARANLDGRVPTTRPVILTDDGHLGFTNGWFGFNIQDVEGKVVVIEASTNLIDWAPLETNTMGAGSLYFSDPSATNYGQRLYRVFNP